MLNFTELECSVSISFLNGLLSNKIDYSVFISLLWFNVSLDSLIIFIFFIPLLTTCVMNLLDDCHIGLKIILPI